MIFFGDLGRSMHYFREPESTDPQRCLNDTPTKFEMMYVSVICRYCIFTFSKQSKKEGKDQESIQSSTTPHPGYQWESDNVTINITNTSQEIIPFPLGDHKASTNRRA